MPGVILIYSCQKYKESRIRDLSYLRPAYLGWKVYFIVGDPRIQKEYEIDRNIITLRCEDSYLHLLKKTILGFKVGLQLVPDAKGILKCGDDIVFNEGELLRFLREETKFDYMGIKSRPFIPLQGSHRDTWIVDYYRRHPEDFENPVHGLPAQSIVETLVRVPTIQAASGPLTYFSRRSCELLIQHMERIHWDVLREVPPYGFPYIIEEPGISFILYAHAIQPTQYTMFTESRELFNTKPFIGLHTNSYKWEGPKKVCIIGAGWYGCHAARRLLKQGMYVRILDKDGIFAGASSKNQNRLHLGYHYPRSPETIRECVKGHNKFLEEYGDCVSPFSKNYYLFHRDSKVSLDEYRRLFEGCSHAEVPLSDLGIPAHNLGETMFEVNEKFIDSQRTKRRMETELSTCLEISNSPSIAETPEGICVNGIVYDYVLNCTNNQYVPVPLPWNPVYETVCSFLYEKVDDTPIGLTVMDGPFFSMFPYDIERKLYTLTHVVHSVLSQDSVEDARKKAEDGAQRVFPSLFETFRYAGYFTASKTKYDFVNDDRSLRWFQKGRYISFSGGKITGIFGMESVLQQTLGYS